MSNPQPYLIWITFSACLFAPPTGSDEHLNITVEPSNTCLDLKHECMKPLGNVGDASQKASQKQKNIIIAGRQHDSNMWPSQFQISCIPTAKMHIEKAKPSHETLLKSRINGSFISSFRSSSWISPSHRIRLSIGISEIGNGLQKKTLLPISLHQLLCQR